MEKTLAQYSCKGPKGYPVDYVLVPDYLRIRFGFRQGTQESIVPLIELTDGIHLLTARNEFRFWVPNEFTKVFAALAIVSYFAGGVFLLMTLTGERDMLIVGLVLVTWPLMLLGLITWVRWLLHDKTVWRKATFERVRTGVPTGFVEVLGREESSTDHQAFVDALLTAVKEGHGGDRSMGFRSR
jgi:hypothetical protein